ncbi:MULTISPECIES: 16S rRNA (guanine(527)-N(7))-methyltransferase RsmG [unclassified Enterococcus]|uniref:16S rRNA (guanine(527)-N(7))-methyltransferase RsmG n=1 Tax=unclassified Enterococcus TaxID=2608891 RepID=UPI001555C810|nr:MULTISPECIES: 16S rRNA (guanine(527)-N(7))-methyltransferase RsmG [unclassified Enterococcus]MBS7576194.1 16S rRNA (guanine(527)-N(7))-methyltransferase RsmG [Enterococcus sp. MMGLQ5-2]MBS7583427.1 16S rRNA (guanine(527)-N(7))-methyltransferase RsmG [Enterococcus sp. MMGLQ5-1]NPD11287.1 16S rRNA (guanine(527)-N(7))-methyltransferase RsmG [Enterococcus sp. MMGLQ5-1]NPD36030.1 16S rRNA (guanine(527)-N(7))-methyltransferase RsmG [Enterococcus sp. MMGLQ5-2]
MKPEEFIEQLKKDGFALSQQQLQQFNDYFHLLVEWNQKINLTAIVERNEVYLKHFYDSIAPVSHQLIYNQPLRLLDVGAGAGFPSIPIKIIFPEMEIHILDSLNKRLTFLTNLIEKLNLKKVYLHHGRAEDLGQDMSYRGSFDIVTARAVARLNVLVELTLPFLKKNGQLIALKAAQSPEELTEARQAIALLGGKLSKAIDYQLPNGDARFMLVIDKKKETPKKYPRRAGVPNKKPL